LIVFVRYHKPDAPPAPVGAAAVSSGGFVEGLRYLWQHLDTAALLFIKVGLSIGSVDALLIAFATTVFVIGENGTGSLGILYSAFGVGAVLGPILLNRFSDRTVRMLRRLTLVSFIMVVVGWLFLGIAPSLPLAALALMLRAMGGSAAWTYSSTMIQMRVPDDLLGRIFSLDWAAFYLMTTISTITTGLLIDVAGREQVRWVVFIAGFASIAPLLLWLLIVYVLERREARILTAESSV
jgi:MFS family permease